jgi:hypothetical protein
LIDAKILRGAGRKNDPLPLRTASQPYADPHPCRLRTFRGSADPVGVVDGPEIALWTLSPSRRLLSARVSAFLDYLKDAFPHGTPEELTNYLEG